MIQIHRLVRPHALMLLLLTACNRTPTLPPSAFDSSPELLPGSQSEIVFAGLAGSSPKFIDAGPERGLGWLENHTRAIRNAMKSEGFQIRQEWMSPSRIAHEFNRKSPICVYPEEWKNPGTTFSLPPDRIYSIPLDLGGEQSRGIFIRKSDTSKFKRHLTPQGDLNIDSLLEDPSLKTQLILGKDYGRLTHRLLDVDSRGEQSVRPQYSTHISTRVIRDKIQIVEMLNAGRFDYVFSDAIDDEDFIKTHIDSSRFLRLTYSTSRVDRASDPNLVFVSIACSVHPLTLRAMPYFNRWIATVRGTTWIGDQLKYRRKTNPEAKDIPASWIYTTAGRFHGELEGGKLDAWYSLQQKHFPTLTLYPSDKKPQTTLPGLAANQKEPLLWRAEFNSQGTLLVFNNADQAMARSDRKNQSYRTPNFNNFFRSGDILQYLSSAELEQIRKSDFTTRLAEESIEGIRLEPLSGTRKLVLFARGLKRKDFEKLRALLALPKLTSLSVFNASPEVSTEVVAGLSTPSLAERLQELNLTRSALTHTPIDAQIAKLPLRTLHLNSTQLSHPQLRRILAHLPDTIESLSLGYQQGKWDQEVAQAFNQSTLGRLKSLDLDSNWLSDEEMRLIVEKLPPSLEILRLGGNHFTFRSAATLFSRPFPNLIELDLSMSPIVSRVSGLIPLPHSIRHLTLVNTNLNPETLDHLKLPQSLETLNVSLNSLGEEGGKALLSQLGDRLMELNAASTGITATAIKTWAQSHPAPARSLTNLNFSGNGLDDTFLGVLSELQLPLKRLGLSQNRIRNQGALKIAQTWIENLTELDLSENLISEEGITAIAHHLKPGLLRLNLSGNLSISVDALAQKLPSSLTHLNLNQMQLNDLDLSVLLPRLPKQLLELGLRGSVSRRLGGGDLARVLPQRLYSLDLQNTPLDESTLGSLVRALPSSLGVLLISGSVGAEALLANRVSQILKDLPQALDELGISKLKVQNGGLNQLFSSLPQTVGGLVLNDIETNLQPPSARSEVFEVPSNLRKLMILGTHLGDDGLASFSKSLPDTLEWVWFGSSGFSDPGFVALAKRDLENVYELNVFGNKITDASLAALASKKRWIRDFALIDCALTNRSAASLNSNLLTQTRQLYLGSIPYSNQALTDIAKRASPHLRFFVFPSSKLTLSGVDSLIAHLPKELREIQISGNQIGQYGLEKFRAYKRKREAQEGIPFNLIE